MGLNENMRARWRLEGSAWMFRAGIGALLLGLCLAQSPSSPTPCPTGGTLLGLTPPQYQENPELDTGVGFMKVLVQSFLNTVQPNPFPEDLILKFVKEFEQIQLDPSDAIKSALLYEVGFLVCAAIGVVYIVLLPVVGLLMACCRCCGNCGGNMYQKQTSSINCRRRALYWSTFLTTLVILAGNVCMFKSNEALKVSVDRSAAEVNSTIGNLHTYLSSVPQEIDRVVNESYKTVDEVAKSLNSIGPLLGKEIQERLKGPLDTALDSVVVMAQEAVSADGHLRELNSSLARLQSSVDLLQADVSSVKDSINRTISKSNCMGCNNLKPELEKLTLGTTISIPWLSELQSAVDDVIKADLNSKVKEGEDYFNSIPQRVTNDTKDVVQSAKQQLGEIKKQISQVTSDIPISGLTNISHTLEQLQRNITLQRPEVDRIEYIRWAVGVAVCCVVLLVVVCNTLGLLLGPLGLSPKVDPTERSCTANCGGTFLMMGAGFSFLFSWLFMILVLLLFVLGGNVFTLVCRPWDNGQLLKFIDTPGLIPGLDLGPMLGLETNLTITDVYRDCEQNKPLWTTLHLYDLIDLDDLLNVSRYTDEIQQHFDKANITLSTITLLSPEIRNQLSTFSDQAKDVDFTAVTQQINNVTSINLNTTADKLTELVNLQSDPTIQSEMREEARNLRQIQSDIETTIYPQLDQLNSSIETLRSTAEKINVIVGNVLSKVGAAQDFLNTNTTQIVKTESREFVDCQMGYFIAYVDWANLTITEQVGRCGPVAGFVDSAEIIICSHMVESLNAFWFSLGWCLIFFIPSMIFSIKLAKYYRRMDRCDVFDNHIAMNHIPRAQIKPY